ncbi:MAG: bh protein [Kyrpidia sp.]|nr:bh protein [Kyrpidia sp.]
MDRVSVELFCIQCNRETVHTVTYVHGRLHDIVCAVCGSETRVDKEAVTHPSDGWLHRILTKPERMTREMKEELTGFLLRLPGRVASKPFRLSKEILDHLRQDRRH